MEDLIVYGVNCTWWAPITDLRPTGSLPVCPHCGSPLFQMAASDWSASIDRHEDRGNPGYRALTEFGKGKCFHNFAALTAAHQQALALADRPIDSEGGHVD